MIPLVIGMRDTELQQPALLIRKWQFDFEAALRQK
jgi:hypothetical protein